MATKSIVCAAALILCAARPATAIECKVLPDLTVRGKWSLDLVDGRLCWFLGDSGTPREQLQWPGREKAEPKQIAGATAANQARTGKSVAPPKPESAQPQKLAGPPTGEKIPCRSEPDKAQPGHWRWRSIDERQCWFIGERTVPKEWLEWPPARAARTTEMEPRQAELPLDAMKMVPLDGQPPDAAAATPASWQIVNPDSAGDLEFLAQDAWIAVMSIDQNLGAQFLTQVPTSRWPVLALRAER
jgi:hypothetical protein